MNQPPFIVNTSSIVNHPVDIMNQWQDIKNPQLHIKSYPFYMNHFLFLHMKKRPGCETGALVV